MRKRYFGGCSLFCSHLINNPIYLEAVRFSLSDAFTFAAVTDGRTGSNLYGACFLRNCSVFTIIKVVLFLTNRCFKVNPEINQRSLPFCSRLPVCASLLSDDELINAGAVLRRQNVEFLTTERLG